MIAAPLVIRGKAEYSASRNAAFASPPGDVVTVTLMPRAGSTFDLSAIVKQIVDAKAQFRSLAEPWADTGTSSLATTSRLTA